MPATVYKGYSVPTPGTESGTWGADLNANTFSVIDANMGGIVTKALSNINVTLSAAESQNLILRLTGALTGAVQVTTSCQGMTIVENATTGAFNVTLANGFGTPVICKQGYQTFIAFDSTNGPRVVADSTIWGLATSGVVVRSAAGVISTDPATTGLMFALNNSGNVVPTGIVGDIYVPFDCTLTAATVLADTAGSLTLDVWKAPYGSYPPTVANSITSGGMVLSSVNKYQNLTLVGWTTTVAAGDVLRINVNSATTITRFTMALTVQRFT
jgi:hypothetical protein